MRAPDRRAWKVRRTLGWPRWRGRSIEGLDGFDLVGFGSDIDSLQALVLAIALVVLLAIFILVFLPLLLFLAELAVLVPAVLLVFRPWRVIASTPGPPPERLEWRVRGWRGSRAAVDEVARELGHGVHAAPEKAE